MWDIVSAFFENFVDLATNVVTFFSAVPKYFIYVCGLVGSLPAFISVPFGLILAVYAARFVLYIVQLLKP